MMLTVFEITRISSIFCPLDPEVALWRGAEFQNLGSEYSTGKDLIGGPIKFHLGNSDMY